MFPPPPPPPQFLNGEGLSEVDAGQGLKHGMARESGAVTEVSAASPLLARAEADGLRYLRRLVCDVGVADPSVELKRWRASFLALLPHPTLHQGEISLKSGGRLILYEEGDNPIDARLMREDEAVGTGDKIMFPCVSCGDWSLESKFVSWGEGDDVEELDADSGCGLRRGGCSSITEGQV